MGIISEVKYRWRVPLIYFRRGLSHNSVKIYRASGGEVVESALRVAKKAAVRCITWQGNEPSNYPHPPPTSPPPLVPRPPPRLFVDLAGSSLPTYLHEWKKDTAISIGIHHSLFAQRSSLPPPSSLSLAHSFLPLLGALLHQPLFLYLFVSLSRPLSPFPFHPRARHLARFFSVLPLSTEFSPAAATLSFSP